MKILIALLINLTVFAGIAFGDLNNPAVSPIFHILPDQPLMDQVVNIRLSGLPPRMPVTIRATMLLAQYTWHSHASFVADQHGNIDLGKLAPLDGSYSGVDPMGLFRSMTPDAAQPSTRKNGEANSLDPVVTNFVAEVEGRPVASVNLTRLWTKPGIRITDIHENGLVGKLFEPQTKGRHPGVLVLSGSEGGIDNWNAALLASHGYTAFALAYFGIEGLPKELVNIPLEYLKNGVDWMRAKKSVDADRIAVIGASKGGELSLLLASMFPEIKVVVAYASGSLIGTGIDREHSGNVSSWSYRGKPLPFARCKATPEFTAQFRAGAPLRLLLLNEPCLKDQEAIRGAVIPVEKIKGAVLLITGGDDQTGPSSLSAEMIMRTLEDHKHAYPYQHLSYKSAGHAIYTSYIPTTISTVGGRLALGGTPEANAEAQADSWQKVLRFLRENLVERTAPVRKTS